MSSFQSREVGYLLQSYPEASIELLKDISGTKEHLCCGFAYIRLGIGSMSEHLHFWVDCPFV